MLSLAALGLEVLLVRLFSIVQWHHFAYMVISLALLGFGVSGTFLALFQRKLLARYAGAYIVCVTAFAVSAVTSFLLAQHIAFNPEELLWDPWQWLRLAVVYMLLAVPFFFAATAIGLTLTRFRHAIARVYAADLVGAGLGALVVIAVLFLASPVGALESLGALGLVTAFVAAMELRVARPLTFGLALAGGVGLVAAPKAWTELQISPYKSLSQTLRVEGTEVAQERSSPLGVIAVVASREIPLRHAPGLSLLAGAGPPPQLGVFTDGDGLSAINHAEASRAFLGATPEAVPYFVGSPRSVLVLGAGGGTEVLRALRFGAQHIDAIELNAQIIALLRDNYREFSGDIYGHPNVHWHAADGRGFLVESAQRYDLIQLPLLGSLGASATGLYALNEDYLHTREAFELYLDRLTADGVVAITRWIRLPPRDAPKLIATAVQALRATGVANPADHVMLIRGLHTSTLLIYKSPASARHIEALRHFCSERAFDTAYYPGMQRQQGNRRNVLQQPYYFDAAVTLLGDGGSRFVDSYKFDIAPATDDRPYFFHFFKWSALGETLERRASGGMALLEAGYLVLIATLLQATLIGSFLVLLPLLLFRRSGFARGQPRARIAICFLSLGLAFLFLEIAFIQKLILFLHHPLYAIATALGAFLVFAGAGSACTPALSQRLGAHHMAWLPIACIVAIGAVYAVGLNSVLGSLATLPFMVKLIVAVALLAPLAFFMGMPFPLALGQLDESVIPWAWGINGCASVVSAVLATVIAIEFGLTLVIILALLLYVASYVAFFRPSRRETVRKVGV